MSEEQEQPEVCKKCERSLLIRTTEPGSEWYCKGTAHPDFETAHKVIVSCWGMARMLQLLKGARPFCP
jgi:hypothetical protein